LAKLHEASSGFYPDLESNQLPKFCLLKYQAHGMLTFVNITWGWVFTRRFKGGLVGSSLAFHLFCRCADLQLYRAWFSGPLKSRRAACSVRRDTALCSCMGCLCVFLRRSICCGGGVVCVVVYLA
jgi:hypothetical protein